MVGARSVKTHVVPEVGEALRQARLHSRQDASAIAHELNMPAAQLLALEEGDFSVFAAEVYARGAYMKYAQYLGLGDQQTRLALARALCAVRESVPLRLHTPAVWWQSLLTARTILIGVVCLAALAVGGYIAWQVQSFWQLPALSVEEIADIVPDQSTITVRGFSEAGARVRVNGEAVLLSPEAAFAIELTLRPGITVVQVEAENAAGRKRVAVVHVLKARDRVAGGSYTPYH